ncbi:MAG: L,D-transpeptidase family protein [Sulfurovaceae bacterium]|nr:L,D-transpeptidase family protein [Sulfurovaceae bacterium]
MKIFKNTLFIIVTILLLVTIEALTITSLKEFNATNSSFQALSSKHKSFGKNVSLSQISYSGKVKKGLMHLIVDKEAITFKNISHQKFIHKIYQETRYTPIWFTNLGLKSSALADLFKTIESDAILSKRGKLYKQKKYLKAKFKANNNRTIEKELLLDIQLTALAKSYLNFHLYGSIKWSNFQNKLRRMRRNKLAADWVIVTPKYDIQKLILTQPMSKIVASTTPTSFGYPKMIKELKRLKRIKRQGGWRKLPNSSQLRFGKSGNHVKRLILRLSSSGDYTCAVTKGSNKFGPCLKKALKRFQRRHGLYPSGLFNNYTRKKMNISVDWKLKKVLLNIDRIKRLPVQSPKERHVMVNIPDFRLYYKERGREKLSMRVIVGDEEHHTPIFSNTISFIVLNPYWIIPDSIVKNELIPNILKNPNYLSISGYEVRKSYNTNRKPINTTKINWARVLKNGQTKRYKFMQPPGKKNALGKIKFKFPNRFSVYLHDTQNKKLFKKGRRAFSHGCIRLSDPKALLATFAPHERSVNYNRAKRILKGKKKTQLNLANHVPVHIVYLTAWINSDGLLHYRNDIYNYDKKQIRSIY